MLQITKMHYKLIFWALIVGITILACLPIHAPQINLNYGDKLNHAAAFGVLYLLAYVAFSIKNKFIVLGLIVYGASIECIQYFLPYREFSLFDIGADILGIIFAQVLIKYFNKKNLRSKERKIH